MELSMTSQKWIIKISLIRRWILWFTAKLETKLRPVNIFMSLHFVLMIFFFFRDRVHVIICVMELTMLMRMASHLEILLFLSSEWRIEGTIMPDTVMNFWMFNKINVFMTAVPRGWRYHLVFKILGVFFQRTGVRFPTHTQQLTIICNYSFRASDDHSGLCLHHTCISCQQDKQTKHTHSKRSGILPQ